MNVIEILEDGNYYYIISELLGGGELFDRIVSQGNFTENTAAYVIRQSLLALNYMHTQPGKPMVHRDLKPENILLESSNPDKYEVKIADFGFSCVFDPEVKLDLTLGSPLYMAPEII